MSILCASRDYFPKLSDRSLVWRVILHPQRLRPVNKWFLLKRLIVGVCETNPDVCISIYHNVNNNNIAEKKLPASPSLLRTNHFLGETFSLIKNAIHFVINVSTSITEWVLADIVFSRISFEKHISRMYFHFR